MSCFNTLALIDGDTNLSNSNLTSLNIGGQEGWFSQHLSFAALTYDQRRVDFCCPAYPHSIRCLSLTKKLKSYQKYDC